MDIFLGNVPQYLTEVNLQTELEPHMKALQITEWKCSKPRGKRIAWVNFTTSSHGLGFLKAHGKVPKLPSTTNGEEAGETKGGLRSAQKGHKQERDHTARLFITGLPVYAEPSNRTVVKPIPRNVPQVEVQPQIASTRGPANSSVAFEVSSIACGKNVFAGSSQTLTFTQQSHIRTDCIGKLTRRALSIVASGQFRIDFPLDTIQDFVAGHGSTLTLVLTEPPRMYSTASDVSRKALAWARRPSCPQWPEHGKYVALCLVYHLTVATFNFESMMQEIRRRDLISVTPVTIPVDHSPQPFIHDYQTSLSLFESHIHDTRYGRSEVPFPLLFQVQALVMTNYLAPSGGTEMIEILTAKWAELRQHHRRAPSVPVTVDSMRKLFQHIPYPSPGTEPADTDPRRLIETVEKAELELRAENPFRNGVYGVNIADHQAWVMKAIITPTRVTLSGPELESKNRILRKYSDYTDYFLRCLFCDEDGQDLAFNPKVSNDAVYEVYRSVLSNGIRIAGRKYSFLGFSHSSLRSHSAWFVAPFMDMNMQIHDHDTIINALGNFEGIRVPAKCAARIGQAFSETPYAVPIRELGIMPRYIPDVKSRDGSRVFSDGVGTISYDAMRECWGYLPQRSRAATSFQIRCGGIKGMLSLDTRLSGKVFCIRKESMMKFRSEDMEELGICDVASRPLRLMLNRQMIKILEDMGTPNSWFLKVQNDELQFIRGVTAKAINTSTFLRYQLIGNSVGFPQFIRQVNDMGIDYRHDKFLQSVVETVVLRELRLLKHKARIPVRKGVTLFGIMDETGFLEPDQIYVAFDKADRIEQPPRSCTALITRSPALHPGDIRIVTMVTPPAGSPLRSLRNCVVFSQRGDRDLPSQLSGGDLDGDLYNVIWDSEAMPQREFAPADYPRVQPKELPSPVTRNDIADFFINFMKTDILGMVATRHQVLADVRVDGTADPECIQLANLHSTAVDSSKTGLPVQVSDLPRPPRTRPDLSVFHPFKRLTTTDYV